MDFYNESPDGVKAKNGCLKKAFDIFMIGAIGTNTRRG
jgi:hypothetical protein